MNLESFFPSLLLENIVFEEQSIPGTSTKTESKYICTYQEQNEPIDLHNSREIIDPIYRNFQTTIYKTFSDK
jgi:hypothetical protein